MTVADAAHVYPNSQSERESDNPRNARACAVSSQHSPSRAVP